MIKLYVDPVITRIHGMDEHDFLVLGELLMFKPAGYFFTTAYQEGRWDGCVRLLHKDQEIGIWTYTGLMGRVLKYLKKEQFEYEMIKSYNLKNIELSDTELQGISLRDYQRDVVESCKAKKRGIVQSPTGSGKTEMFVKLAADINLRSLIIVNRTALLAQVADKLKKRLGFRESEINVIGADRRHYDPKNYITIGTFQSLMNGKWNEALTNAEMIIFDEVHHVAANKLGDIAQKCRKARVRFGFSATAWREDGREMEIEAFIGQKIAEISISKLIREGYLVKPKIYFIKTLCNADPRLSYDKLYKILVDNPIRNDFIARAAYEWAKRGKTVLISILRVRHGKIIQDAIKKIDDIGLDVKVVTGSNELADKIDTIEKLNVGHYNIVISTLFGEGVDVPNLDCLINARAVKSAIDAFQQVGRALRKPPDKARNKENAFILDFYDYNPNVKTWNATHDKKKVDFFKRCAGKRKKLYESEPEFEVKVIDKVEDMFEQ